RTRRDRRGRRQLPRTTSTSLLLLSGRDRFDDADRVEAGELRRQRGVGARRGLEDVEAELVLGNVDRVCEADERPLPCQLLGGGLSPVLPGGALACAAAGEVGLDEVARHALDPRSGPAR